MRVRSWRWILAVVQIAAAFAALVFAPSQWKAHPHLIGDCTLVGFRQTWPPPILRVTYAVNFPALVASNAVQYASWSDIPVLHRREAPFVWVSVQDGIFLVNVGFLWYWLGSILDRRLEGHNDIRRSKPLAVVGLTSGCLFAITTTALATFYATRTNADRPYRQIGPFGLVWSAMLLCYFCWRLIGLYKAGASHDARSHPE
jgi:hypothetical protein